MLHTVFRHVVITYSSVAPKLASRVLGPAVSAGYAGACKCWFSSTQAKKKATFKDMTDDFCFDENEWDGAGKFAKRKLDVNRFVADHTFDPSEEYEKLALIEEAAKKPAIGKAIEIEPLVIEQPNAEELSEIELEHNKFITDHTFDVNNDKIQKNLMATRRSK